MFKSGDQVLIDGQGPYTLQHNPSSQIYPLAANSMTFTPEGRFEVSGAIRLSPYYTILNLPTGTLIALTDGTRIYQPTSGNPIQLTSTPKELL